MEKKIEKDTIVRERIIDISHEGQGIIKSDGYTVFVKDGFIDDLVDVKITKTKKNFGFGEVVNIIEESKYKIESKCPVSNECGGCQFQELEYAKQLEYKEDKVRNNLMRIGEIDNPNVNEIIGMENPYRYRNNVQIPVKMSNNKAQIGYYKKGSNYIVDTNICIIQDEIADRAISVLRDFMNKNIEDGLKIKHLIVRTASKTKDTMIVLVVNKRIKNRDILVDLFVDNISEIKTIVLNINTEDKGILYGKKSEILFGNGYIEDTIGEYRYNISKESFFQVNSTQTEKLYGKVKEYLNLNGDETLIDLYCGIGTIGISLANTCKKVIGIDIVKEAIEDGKKNLKLNNINNMEFIQGLAEDILPKLVEDNTEIDALVVDPPRKGLDEKVVEAILKLKPKKLVYVSCDPSTLSRDLKALKEIYNIKEVQPIDMFAMGVHVECVVFMER